MKFFLEKPIKKVISKKKHPVENLWKTCGKPVENFFAFIFKQKNIFFI
jgi:hypothetical protein